MGEEETVEGAEEAVENPDQPEEAEGTQRTLIEVLGEDEQVKAEVDREELSKQFDDYLNELEGSEEEDEVSEGESEEESEDDEEESEDESEEDEEEIYDQAFNRAEASFTAIQQAATPEIESELEEGEIDE